MTPDDLDGLLEWQVNQSLVCGGCGNYLDETTNPEAHESEFCVDRVVCVACAAKERVSHADHKDNKRPGFGTKYRVRRRLKSRRRR